MIPRILFHKILAGYSLEPKEHIEFAIESILVEGLIPQVATAYNLEIPEKIRKLPVIWLAREFSSFDYRTLSIQTSYLCLDRLYKLSMKYVNWWIYQGIIPSQAIALLGGYISRSRLVRS